MSEVSLPARQAHDVPESVGRRNQALFVIANTLVYFSAPVTYVGVVHAALLDRFGASATVANLPESVSLLGFFAPLMVTRLAGGRPPQTVIAWAYGSLSCTLVLVGGLLLLPVGLTLRVAALTAQALTVGASLAVGQVFMMECLKAGTQAGGMVRAFKLAFSIGPAAAVLGSVCAQWIVSNPSPMLAFPANYAALFFLFAPCLMVLAVVGRMYVVPGRVVQADEPLRAEALSARLKAFFSNRTMATAWLAYLLFFLGLQAMANTSLYTRQAIHRDPAEISGWILALRFGSKSAFGFVLGTVAQRKGVLPALRGTLVALAGSMIWASTVPGYPFLLAFAFFGAAELGGVYFPGYVLAVSKAGFESKNLAFLTLASVAAAGFPALHGALTDWLGFRASFWCAGLAALAALLLTVRLPQPRQPA